MVNNRNNNSENFMPIVGIDLGTTNSAVSYIKNGKPMMIADDDGNTIIPSVVLIDPNEKVIVGEDARSALVAMPDRTKASVKREMGSVEPIELADKSYLPEEISSLILEKIKTLADDAIGDGDKEAVITVPAYFTDEQRKATKKAGELAGFKVERIINEPTAAALAFGFQFLDEDRHLVVYDLGGGTFDVSIVEIMSGIIEVKASAGNNKLGGEDFDWLLVDWMAESMLADHKVDPRKDVRGKALLKAEAEEVKKQLSEKTTVDISLPVVVMKDGQPLGFHKTITQDIFISLIDSLLQETMEKVTDVLSEADLTKDEVDDILLVGGSTRIPRVHKLIAEFFQKQPRQDVHPDEAVALGAGVQAGIKSGALSDSGLIVTDVAPFSMGIAVLTESQRSGGYAPIISRNTTIPVTQKQRFYTSSPFQTEVQIEVYQGEEEWVKDNYFINEFTLAGLPPAPAGNEAVDVTFRYNLNGILEVTAEHASSGKSMRVTMEDAIDRSSDEAYEESLEKIETATNDRYEDDDGQQNIFDFLEDDDEMEETDLDELIGEARDIEKRCQEALKDAAAEDRVDLQTVIQQLKKALHDQEEESLEESIDEATDILIGLE